MARYIALRVMDLFIVVLMITIATFLLSYYAPGDPAEMLLERRGGVHSEAEIERLRDEMGLNKPIHIQYGIWLKKMLTLDLGESYVNGEAVLQGMLKRLPLTLKLALYAILYVILLAFPLGIVTAWYKDSWLDYAIRAVITVLSSIPSFLLGLILILVFCLHFKVFTVLPGDASSPGSFVLPVIALGTGLALVNIRLFRASLIETLQQDYIKSLRAMGMAEVKILFSHTLRNSLVPVVTSLGIMAGHLLTGAAIIETVFGLNGIGRYAVQAVFNHDYNVILGYVMISSIIFIAVNLVIDLIYWSIDPRIRGEF